MKRTYGKQTVQITITLDEYVGRQMRKAREAKGLTQDQFGKLVGLSGGEISRYEVGKNQPGVVRFLQIAEALDKPPKFFFPKEEKDETPVEPPVSSASGLSPT